MNLSVLKSEVSSGSPTSSRKKRDLPPGGESVARGLTPTCHCIANSYTKYLDFW